MAHELVLDAAVRNWVLIPLTLSVVLMMVLRQYITKVRSSPLLSAEHNVCSDLLRHVTCLSSGIALSRPACCQRRFIIRALCGCR